MGDPELAGPGRARLLEPAELDGRDGTVDALPPTAFGDAVRRARDDRRDGVDPPSYDRRLR